MTPVMAMALAVLASTGIAAAAAPAAGSCDILLVIRIGDGPGIEWIRVKPAPMVAVEHSERGRRTLAQGPRGAGGEITSTLEIAKLEALHLGDMTVRGLPVLVVEEMPRIHGRRIAGILGLEVLARAGAISFGYGEGREAPALVFAPPPGREPPDAVLRLPISASAWATCRWSTPWGFPAGRAFWASPSGAASGRSVWTSLRRPLASGAESAGARGRSLAGCRSSRQTDTPPGMAARGKADAARPDCPRGGPDVASRRHVVSPVRRGVPSGVLQVLRL